MSAFSPAPRAAIVALASAVMIGAAPLAQNLTTPEPLAGCDVGQWPEFNYGFAALHNDVGDAMGEPVECEHSTDADGDSAQRTTTGIANYDSATNVPSFERGTDHWAISVRGLVFWSSPTQPRLPPDARVVPVVAGPTGASEPTHSTATTPASPDAFTAFTNKPLNQTPVGLILQGFGFSNARVDRMTLRDVVNLVHGSNSAMGEAARALGSD